MYLLNVWTEKATEESPHPTLVKTDIILYLSAFLQFVPAAPLLIVSLIHGFSVLSIAVPSNPLPPGTEPLLRLGGREASQQLA